jgi:NADH-quinone oxidoreductase subunit C
VSDTPETDPAPDAAEPAPEAPEATEPAPEAPEAAESEPEAPEPERTPDPVRDPLMAKITGDLGDAVLGQEVVKGDMWLRVANPAWRRTIQYLKDHGFDYFCFLSGIDWLPSQESVTRYEQVYTDDAPADPPARESGITGGDSRFQVFVRLYDVDRKVGITVKADLDDDEQPTVESVVAVFRGAEWHEREAWEMFGFEFTGHPGLRHLYLPKEFEGFPLRKDFPLLARAVKPWPGLVDKEPVPGEGEDEEEEAAATT